VTEFVTSSLAVFVVAIVVKLTELILIESCLKTRKEENMEIKIFLHKSASKISFRHIIYSLLRQTDVRESADIMYRI